LVAPLRFEARRDSSAEDVENARAAPTYGWMRSQRAPDEEKTMKYMVMMFGTAEEMFETQSPEWIKEMIGFMIQLNGELQASGELVAAEGLVDSTQAKVVKQTDTGVVVTDGPYGEAKESLVGYWILDVADEARIVEIASRIVKYSGSVELREVADGPPPVD
jgi:hypothetical protein